MSSESLIITVGASVGVAIAALGSVENKIARLGEASARLGGQQARIGKAIESGVIWWLSTNYLKTSKSAMVNIFSELSKRKRAVIKLPWAAPHNASKGEESLSPPT